MEATSCSRTYAPSWKLTFEFMSDRAQTYFNNEHFRNLVLAVFNDHPWTGPYGTTYPPLVSEPTVRTEFHPDYGPETTFTIDHPALRLSQRQLWAYESWAQNIANEAVKRLSGILRSIDMAGHVIQNIRMTFATPITKPSSSYRLESTPGDIVRMACGTLAVITAVEILACGHVKQLTLRPICGIVKHLFLLVRRKLHPVDDEIDALAKVGEVSLP